MKKWEELPIEMQVEEVRPYYDALKRRKFSLFFKRIFDIVVSFLMLVILSPVCLILAIAIKIDSPGSVFFRQFRVTQYGKQFRIFKFRTMVSNAEKIGTQVTVGNDSRVTRVGKVLRRYRLDEIAQLLDVLRGTMTFVGVRPEVVKYVEKYTPEMRATLLLPAGVTNLTCIYYIDEDSLLADAEDIDETYITQVLPGKMKLNLKGIMDFSFGGDMELMFMTFFAVLGRECITEKIDKKQVEVNAKV